MHGRLPRHRFGKLVKNGTFSIRHPLIERDLGAITYGSSCNPVEE